MRLAAVLPGESASSHPPRGQKETWIALGRRSDGDDGWFQFYKETNYPLDHECYCGIGTKEERWRNAHLAFFAV